MNLYVVSALQDDGLLVPLYLLESDRDIYDSKKGLLSYLELENEEVSVQQFSFKYHSDLPTLDVITYIGGHFIHK